MKRIKYLSVLLIFLLNLQNCEASSSKLIKQIKSRLVGSKILITNDSDAPDAVKSFSFFAPNDVQAGNSNFDSSPNGFADFTYILRDSEDQIYIGFGEASIKNVTLTIPLVNQNGLIEFQLFWNDFNKQYEGRGRVITVSKCADATDFSWVEYICNSNTFFSYKLVDF